VPKCPLVTGGLDLLDDEGGNPQCQPDKASAQNVQPRAHRDSGSTFVREQVVDCGTRNPKEVCVISYDSETPR